MADSLNTAAGTRPVAPAGARGSVIRSLLREPLLHFLLIGAALFALNHFLDTTRNADRSITVTPELRRQLTDEFVSLQGRTPTADEYARVAQNWILNEILFREAMALRLDRGDDMIHERVAQKMRLLVFGGVIVPKPTEAELRAWFEARRGEFDVPAQIDFFAVAVTGPDPEGKAKSYLAAIETGNDPPELRARARVFANRTPAALAEIFGQPFADRLVAMPLHTWWIAQSGVGWHLVRVDAVRPARPADFAELRPSLEVAWTDEHRRRLAVQAVKDLGARYDVRREDLR